MTSFTDLVGANRVLHNTNPVRAEARCRLPRIGGRAGRGAELADIGLCIEWHDCWMEAGLKTLLRQAIPMTGLVQVSDYVLGDRTAPCRAVPDDGVIPLDRILGDVLDAGYEGVFNIDWSVRASPQKGARAATERAAHAVSVEIHPAGGLTACGDGPSLVIAHEDPGVHNWLDP